MGNFYTDVICKDRRFHSVQLVNDLALLEPVTRAAIQCIVADAARLGRTLVVLETFRSCERQGELFRKGATELKDVGVHHYGLACDLGLQNAGRYDPKGEDYLFLRDLAEAHGLIWGGDWGTPKAPHNFRDYDHVQRCAVSRQSGLLGDVWYPDAAYNPLADLGRAVKPCAGQQVTPAPTKPPPKVVPAKAAPVKTPAPRPVVKAAGKRRRV